MYSTHVVGGTNKWTFNGRVTATNNCSSTIKYFSESGSGNPPRGGCFSISNDEIISAAPSCFNDFIGFNFENPTSLIKNVSVYNTLDQS